MKRKALGRGLDALLPSLEADDGPRLREIPMDQLQPNADQPRRRFDQTALDELARSIATQGVIQPIIVSRIDDHFRIIVGERRWRAALKAGLTTMPALIRDADDEQTLVLGLIENLQREDLSPIEQANAFKMLLERHGLTQQELAERMGRDRATIANMVRLLNLPSRVLAMIDNGELSTGHGKALLALDDPDDQLALALKVIEHGWSVRRTEEEARRLAAGTAATSKTRVPAQIEMLQERLARRLGTRVKIRYGRNRGRIVIDYFSPDELDRLIELLQSLPET